MGAAVFYGMVGVTVFGIFLTLLFYALLREKHREEACPRLVGRC